MDGQTIPVHDYPDLKRERIEQINLNVSEKEMRRTAANGASHERFVRGRAKRNTHQVTTAEVAALVAETQRLRKKVGVHCHGDHAAMEVIFFFFQAEDGIRDLTVTGVQTCALPI